jgi:hypothetical protein
MTRVGKKRGNKTLLFGWSKGKCRNTSNRSQTSPQTGTVKKIVVIRLSSQHLGSRHHQHFQNGISWQTTRQCVGILDQQSTGKHIGVTEQGLGRKSIHRFDTGVSSRVGGRISEIEVSDANHPCSLLHRGSVLHIYFHDPNVVRD